MAAVIIKANVIGVRPIIVENIPLVVRNHLPVLGLHVCHRILRSQVIVEGVPAGHGRARVYPYGAKKLLNDIELS